MDDLTPLVQGHLNRLFRASDQAEVARLLSGDCGVGLPGVGAAKGRLVERIQCAALKVSAGRIDKLYDAIALAQTDWRDLLVMAGFANDVRAHENWRD